MKNLLLCCLVAVIASGMTLHFAPSQSNAIAEKETSFERVLRTNTIRCGYAVWWPEMIKDPNTGAMSGYDYDVMNEVGKLLGLKVEWVEEVGWGVVEQGLLAGRYDMGCNGYWGAPTRTKAAFYSIPFNNTPNFFVLNPKIAPDIKTLADLNNEKYTMAVLEGTFSDILHKFYVPKAKKLDPMALATDGNLLMDIQSGKADFTFANLSPVERFLKEYPGGVVLFPDVVEVARGKFLLPHDDIRLKTMVDDALMQLINSGVVDRIIQKYMGDDHRAWLPITPKYPPSFPNSTLPLEGGGGKADD